MTTQATVSVQVGERTISVRVPLDAALRAVGGLLTASPMRAAVLAQLSRAAGR